MINRIVIADRDHEMGAILASELKSECQDVCLVQDGLKLIQKLRNESFQLVVLSHILPELSGHSLLQEIRKIRSSDELAVLMISEPLEDRWVAEAIEKGANDFLFKPYQRGQLLSRVRALNNRFQTSEKTEAYLSGQYILGKFRLNLHSSDFYQGDIRTHLTPSEFKLLEALFRHRGSILTRDQLIEEVQGTGVAVVDRAIDTHVFSLRKKLGEFSSLIETVRGVGYRITLEKQNHSDKLS